MYSSSIPSSGSYPIQIDLTSDHSPEDHIDSQPNPSSSKKGNGTRWTPLENSHLISAYKKHKGDWTKIKVNTPQLFNKSKASCIYQYENYLDPNLKKGSITEDEIATINELFEQHQRNIYASKSIAKSVHRPPKDVKRLLKKRIASQEIYDSLDEEIIKLVKFYGSKWLTIRSHLLLSSAYFDILESGFDIKKRFMDLSKNFNSSLNSKQKESVIRLRGQSVCISKISAKFLISRDQIDTILIEGTERESEKESAKRKSTLSSLESTQASENVKKKQRSASEKEEIEKSVSGFKGDKHQTISFLKAPFMDKQVLESCTFKRKLVITLDRLQTLDDEIIANVKTYGNKSWGKLFILFSNKYAMLNIQPSNLRARFKEILKSWGRKSLSEIQKEDIIQQKIDGVPSVLIAIKFKVCTRLITEVFSEYLRKNKNIAKKSAPKKTKKRSLPVVSKIVQEKLPQTDTVLKKYPQEKISPKYNQGISSSTALALKTSETVKDSFFSDSTELPLHSLEFSLDSPNLGANGDEEEWTHFIS